jgi:hypothetical protein
LTVTLRSGLKIILRLPPALDLTTAHDIFVSEIYDPAGGCGAGPGSLIVDVGGNVGYSSLYFANRFPEAGCLRSNPIRRSRGSSTGTWRSTDSRRGDASAGGGDTAAGTATLTDAEDSSALADRPALRFQWQP